MYKPHICAPTAKRPTKPNKHSKLNYSFTNSLNLEYIWQVLEFKRSVQTVVRHGEDGDLRDGSVTTFNTTCSLVDGRQIGVHVTRETTATRHFLSSCRYLEQNNYISIDENSIILFWYYFLGCINRTKSSYFMLETYIFNTFCRRNQLMENNQQKFRIVVYR